MANASFGRLLDHTGEGEAAVEVEIDQIAVFGRADEAGKDADALRILAARHAPDQLIDDAVKAPIVVERLARLAGHGDQRATRIEALMLEGAEVIPPADLDGARKPALLIVAIDALDHQQRVVVELEVEPVIVAALRIVVGARRRGIAVIDADH